MGDCHLFGSVSVRRHLPLSRSRRKEKASLLVFVIDKELLWLPSFTSPGALQGSWADLGQVLGWQGSQLKSGTENEQKVASGSRAGRVANMNVLCCCVGEGSCGHAGLLWAQIPGACLSLSGSFLPLADQSPAQPFPGLGLTSLLCVCLLTH